MRRAWYLNLDAEIELDSRCPYRPRRAVLEQMAARGVVLDSLVSGELRLGMTDCQRFDSRLADVALCWCPTPRALAVLDANGWPHPASPSRAVLERVNERRFLLELSPRADADMQRQWVDSSSDLSWLEGGDAIRLKRRFGFAGRGQRTLRAQAAPDDRMWICRAARDGFLREREVSITEQWTLHGYVDAGGLLLGAPCRQYCDRFGSVVDHERVPTWFAHENELAATARTVSEALFGAGYFGPFGIDAFIHADGPRQCFNPLSDINARFTLLWSTGMGELREAALERLCRLH